jgi:hypothetical protein
MSQRSTERIVPGETEQDGAAPSIAVGGPASTLPPEAPAPLQVTCEDGPARRAYGRLRTESLGTNMGIPLDLSIGGMRLVMSRKPKGVFSVSISDGQMAVTVKARVAWAQKIGFRRHIVGLAFVEATPDEAQMITRLAMSGRNRRVI